MNIDDFRCMRRGAQIALLKQTDLELIKPLQIHNGKKNTALLLLHGFSSTPAVFRHLLTSLTAYDAVILPCLPGHGNNLDQFSSFNRAELIDYAEKNCAHLMNEFEQVDVMGLSLGGVLACHLSQIFKLRHLYLLAPALDLHLNIGVNIALARSLKLLGFRYLRNAAGSLFTEHSCEIAFRQLPLTAIIEVLSLINEFKFIPPACPTDLLLGQHDKVVNSQAVAARFANNPQTTTHWLSHSAHVLPLDGDIEQITNLFQELLA